MNRLINKLNNKGVSILFAMLLFLVVSLVSITIIGASSSSAKRIASNVDTTQSNLYMDSAVKMLKQEIDGVVATTVDIYSGNTYFTDILVSIDIAYNNSQNASSSYQTDAPIKIKVSRENNLESTISIRYKYNFISGKEFVVFKLTDEDSDNTIYVKFGYTVKYETWRWDGPLSKYNSQYFMTFNFSGVSRNDYE